MQKNIEILNYFLSPFYLKKVFHKVLFFLFFGFSQITFADTLTFGLTDDNFDNATDWGFIEAAIDIDDTKRIIVGGGANIGAFDADHGAYIGAEIEYPIFDKLDITARAIYIMNESFNNKALRTSIGAKYLFKKTSFYAQYRSLPNTLTDPNVSLAGQDPNNEFIFGALHSFNKTFSAGIDLSKSRFNKVYFKTSF